MDYHETMTRNTCADISIKERPYDYKDSKNVSYNKNHLYFIDQENLIQECTLHLKDLESSLINNITLLSTLKEITQYSNKVLTIIRNGRDTKQTAPQIDEQLLLFMKNTAPPKTFKIPLLIYKQKANISELSTQVSYEEATTIPLEPGQIIDVNVK